MYEGEVDMLMESFAFLIEPMVHGAGARGRHMDLLLDGVGAGVEGCLI
jgi:hypothetical protein